MKKITDNVFLYKDTCNVYIIKDNDSAVLIDFGSGGVMDYLKDIGINKISAVLITHHHRDQVQGLTSDFNIFVPHNEQDFFTYANEYWISREILNNYNSRQDRFTLLNSIKISGTLIDYSNFKIGNISFYIIPTPGHTTGSISIKININEQEIFFTGDLIYQAGKIWSLAATQWNYNGGEGLPYTVLSLLHLYENSNNSCLLLPSHGEPMDKTAINPTIDNILELIKLRRHNPNLLKLRENPYEIITPHVLRNRTSMSDSYVLISNSGKSLIIDFGYDFIAGIPPGVERSSRRPWAYTVPKLFKQYGIKQIDACIPTHYHDDHVAGMNLLKSIYNTKIICSDIFADILENPNDYDIPCLWYDPIDVNMRVSSSFDWEEYNIKLHHLPGHTKYAVAIEFIADGKKFLCGGDQYADSDGLEINYVYKNIFFSNDYVKTAELYNNIKPDIMLTGHSGAIKFTQEYYNKILQRGKKTEVLHDKLLPYKDFGNSFLAVFKPYSVFVKSGETFEARIIITNPKNHNIEFDLYMPDDFEAISKQISSTEFKIMVKTPTRQMYRERIACDICINGTKFGQQAEMLVYSTI